MNILKQPKFLPLPNTASNTISIYTIDATTGVLLQISVSPFSLSNLFSPRFISVLPSGLFVFVAKGKRFSVACSSNNTSTGVLTLLGASFAAPVNIYTFPINAGGKFLYAAF